VSPGSGSPAIVPQTNASVAAIGDLYGRLKAYGLFHEIISWKLRMFVPTDASGVEVLAKVFDRYPVERIGEREAA